MGVSFYKGEYDPVDNVTFSYMGFAQIRTVIALKWNPKFGALYARLPQYIRDMDAFNKKMNEIINEEKLNDSPVLDFLLASDCEGSATPEVCRMVAALIPPDSYPDFKELLLECADHNEPMNWS